VLYTFPHARQEDERGVIRCRVPDIPIEVLSAPEHRRHAVSCFRTSVILPLRVRPVG
jgi:hypothetical protein